MEAFFIVSNFLTLMKIKKGSLKPNPSQSVCYIYFGIQ
jgi:hypothetical protein